MGIKVLGNRVDIPTIAKKKAIETNIITVSNRRY